MFERIGLPHVTAMAASSGPYSGTINFGEVLPTGMIGSSGSTGSGLPMGAHDKVYVMSSMNSTEQQLMLLKLKQQQLVKLQQHKHKLEQQLADHVTHVVPKQKVMIFNREPWNVSVMDLEFMLGSLNS